MELTNLKTCDMYNPNYKPTTSFVPAPKVTVGEARTKAKYHGKIVQSGEGVIDAVSYTHLTLPTNREV